MSIVYSHNLHARLYSRAEKNNSLLPSGTPLGHLPTLEVDGKTVCGSTGIARFLAERFGE